MTDPKALSNPHGLSRRQSLKLFGMMLASAAVPAITGCAASTPQVSGSASDWPTLKIEPISVAGYGQDPNLIMPPPSPWPKTLTTEQIARLSRLTDILVPAQNGQPGALQIGAVDVIDEWVSAPYGQQQRDRDGILRLLIWLDDESGRRYSQPFLMLSEAQQLVLLDDIAYDRDNIDARLQQPAAVFNRLRSLVLAAYFCSEAGSREIGYQGNVPISGEYPGPTPEAMAHLDDVLDELGLSDYAYQQ
jgi:hypothetical protein